jgi:hypothetical protein
MDHCEIVGHDDFYGIGVRIGFYLQYLVFIWAGALFLFKGDLSERAGAALALWLFKFGTMAALLHDFVSSKKLVAAEIYIVLLLLLRIPILRLPGLLFDLIARVPQPRMSRDDVSDSVASLALLTIDVGISAWFWAVGVQTKSLSTPCHQVGFLFSKFDLTAPWFKITNLVCLFCFYAAALLMGWRRSGIAQDHKEAAKCGRRISQFKYANYPLFKPSTDD